MNIDKFSCTSVPEKTKCIIRLKTEEIRELFIKLIFTFKSYSVFIYLVEFCCRGSTIFKRIPITFYIREQNQSVFKWAVPSVINNKLSTITFNNIRRVWCIIYSFVNCNLCHIFSDEVVFFIFQDSSCFIYCFEYLNIANNVSFVFKCLINVCTAAAIESFKHQQSS